jgi:hydrogenase maturation protease
MPDNTSQHKVCIASIGNTLRSDDGLGSYISSHLTALGIQGLYIYQAQQLQLELIEEFIDYQTIVFVDASLGPEGVIFEQLNPYARVSQPDSHQMNPAMLSAVLEKLYPARRVYYLCSVQGKNFEMGETLSQAAKKNAAIAIKAITAFLYEKGLVPGN